MTFPLKFTNNSLYSYHEVKVFSAALKVNIKLNNIIHQSTHFDLFLSLDLDLCFFLSFDLDLFDLPLECDLDLLRGALSNSLAMSKGGVGRRLDPEYRTGLEIIQMYKLTHRLYLCVED